MRLDGSDDGNRAAGGSDGLEDDGRVPAHRMDVLVAHLFETLDTCEYRTTADVASQAASRLRPVEGDNATAAAAAEAGDGAAASTAANDPRSVGGPPPPHALFLLAPGGLLRRPSGVECFEMADCADPRGTGRMGVRGFLAGVNT